MRSSRPTAAAPLLPPEQLRYGHLLNDQVLDLHSAKNFLWRWDRDRILGFHFKSDGRLLPFILM